jgi:O-antigen/teichoic acid export membrane protein
MSLVFVPVYIAYIGIEAYGILGFYAALQSLFIILDFGVSATLNRELARREEKSTAPDGTRDLVRTLEWFCWPTAVVIAAGVWLLSTPLAQHWLKTVSLAPEQAATALALLGLATALQWPASFYIGALSGLQRQVLLNALGTTFATVRAVGAIGVLAWVSPTLDAYLWWQVGMSAVQSACYAWITWHHLPRGAKRPSFSMEQLGAVGGFAAGITGITLLSFLLTHTDRIVLSRVLDLDHFGVYAFAAGTAAAMLRLVSPVVTAAYPRYSQLVAARKRELLVEFYHRTNQALAAVLVPVAVVVVLFPTEILWLWTRNARLAHEAAPILALLVAGTTINGLLNLPYALQLAYGWTGLGFRVNVVAVCIIVPAVWYGGSRFGGVGAAAAWLALNIGYLTVGIPLMHRRVLRDQMWRWYGADLLPPFAAALAVGGAWRLMLGTFPDRVAGIALLVVIALTSAAAAAMACPFPRSVVLDRVTTLIRTRSWR